MLELLIEKRTSYCQLGLWRGILSDNAIELQSVSKNFGRIEAVKRLDLSVRRGEIFGFLGPNGAGKSTTIRMITGILEPDDGRIVVGDKDISIDPVAVKRIIGYVPDDPFVYRYLTGREFLFFVGSVWGLSNHETRHMANTYLGLFPTIDDIDLPFYTYSRGTRQKLMFVAALLHKPDILIIDEPMSGLDPQSIRTIKELLVKLSRQQGMTVFVSTHTLEIAQEICDRLAIINRGNLVACGSFAELKRQVNVTQGSLEELFLALT